jgi:hypothetical protein
MPNGHECIKQTNSSVTMAAKMGRWTWTALHSHTRRERWSTAPYLGHASPSIPALRPRRGGDPYGPKSLCLHHDKNPFRSIPPIRRGIPREKYSKIETLAFPNCATPDLVATTLHGKHRRTHTQFSADRYNAERRNGRDSPVGERGAASACGEGGGGGAQRGAICGGHRIHPNGRVGRGS